MPLPLRATRGDYTGSSLFRNRRFHHRFCGLRKTAEAGTSILTILLGPIEQQWHHTSRCWTLSEERVVRKLTSAAISPRLRAIFLLIRATDSLQLPDGVLIVRLWFASRPVLLD